MYDFYDPAPEYSSAAWVLCLKEWKLMFCGSAAPEYSGEAKVVRISYVSSKQGEIWGIIDYIPFLNVKLQAASLKTFQSP